MENCSQSDVQEPPIQGSGCSGSINFTFCKNVILSGKSERLSSKIAPIGFQNASLGCIQGARGAGFGPYDRTALPDWCQPCPAQPSKQTPPPWDGEGDSILVAYFKKGSLSDGFHWAVRGRPVLPRPRAKAQSLWLRAKSLTISAFLKGGYYSSRHALYPIR